MVAVYIFYILFIYYYLYIPGIPEWSVGVVGKMFAGISDWLSWRGRDKGRDRWVD
jgi:hypothetical protein